MDLVQMNTFLKIVSAGSFSKAAEQLDYSQSTVTVQMKNLEATLGVQLFDRIGRSIQLTSHGRAFIPHAQRIIRVMHEAEHFANDATPKGPLRIGCAESIAHSVIAPELKSFHETYPEVEITLETEKATDEMLLALKGNELDLIYTLDEPVYGQEWVKIIEEKEPIIFVTGREMEHTDLSLENLVKQPFILTERGVSYQSALEKRLAERSLDIHPMLEIGNTQMIAQLLKEGLGISFLPQFTVQDALERGTLIQLQTDMAELTMDRQLIIHEKKWMTPQMTAFIDHMKRASIKKND